MTERTEGLPVWRRLQQLQAAQAWPVAYLPGAPWPTPPRLERLIEMFRRLAFPQWSHLGGPEVCDQVDFWKGTVGQFSEAVGELLRWSERETTGSAAELHSALEAECPGKQTNSIAEIQTRLLERLPVLAERLQRDVQAACLGDPACLGPHEVVVCYPGFTAILVHRLAHELYQSQCRLAARVLAEWAHGTTGIDIHPGATIGDSFFIDHGTGVVIGETCVVGNHVKIYQGVTLGALSFTHDATGKVIREAKRHPTIEDHVVIYAGATVLGGATVVGHHSVIGGSVWLTTSIAPFSTVVCDKPRLKIRSQTASEGGGDFPWDFQI